MYAIYIVTRTSFLSIRAQRNSLQLITTFYNQCFPGGSEIKCGESGSVVEIWNLNKPMFKNINILYEK